MKKVYKIDVDCPNCAASLERAVQKTDGVENATVNFMTQKLTIHFAENADVDAVMADVVKACKKATSHGKICL